MTGRSFHAAKRWSLLLIASTAVSCGSSPISNSIDRTVARGVGTPLVIAEHAPFAWDRVCIFGPYTSDETIDSVTGIKGASGHSFDVGISEAVNVLVFVDKSRVVESIAYTRRGGDFGPELVRKCYQRKDASFVIRIPPKGSWGNIGPR